MFKNFNKYLCIEKYFLNLCTFEYLHYLSHTDIIFWEMYTEKINQRLFILKKTFSYISDTP